MKKILSFLVLLFAFLNANASDFSYVTSDKTESDEVYIEAGTIIKVSGSMHISYREGNPSVYLAVYLDDEEIYRLDMTKFGATLRDSQEYEVKTSGKHTITLKANFTTDHNNKSGGYMSASYVLSSSDNVEKSLYDAIYVWTSSTEYTCYLFKDTPSFTYENHNLVLSVNGTEVKRIPLKEVEDVEVTYGIKYPDVTLNSKGYATLSFKADMQLNSDCIKAYTAKVDGNKIICTEIADGIIPAGNGVLLHGTASASAQLVEATSTSALTNNDLLPTTLADGSLAPMPTTGYNYVLNGNLFYEYSGTSFVANKAYFNLSYKPSTSSGAKLSILFAGEEDEATSIESVDKATVPTVVYDLQGRKVTNPSNGVYIINNKKVVIK